MIDTTAIERAESTALAPQETMGGPLRPADVVGQVALIQQVMSAVMRDKEHYGTIPGCGDKPTLLKPGAEKLAMTFRLAPDFEIDERDMGAGHREYLIRCRLVSINTGQLVGTGVGSCSTMESKYRWRTGPVEFTGEPVPGQYWAKRKEAPAEAQKLIGGKGHSTKKNPDTGAWEIVIVGDKVENPDIADQYNTVLKMAKKRAFVDAVLSTTAASDIFTQDIEDLPTDEEGSAPTASAQTAPAPTPAPEPAKVSPEALTRLRELRDQAGVDNDKYAEQIYHFGVDIDSELLGDHASKLIAAYERRIAADAQSAPAEDAAEALGGEWVE